MHPPETVLMRTKLAFGIGASGEAGTLWMFNALTFFFYNQILGLPADLAGMAVFIAIVFDAILIQLWAQFLIDSDQSMAGDILLCLLLLDLY